MDKILFMVEHGNAHFITYAYHREGAKSNASRFLAGEPDHYIVTPLTEPGDRIFYDYITIHA